jgi:hypothetical protein
MKLPGFPQRTVHWLFGVALACGSGCTEVGRPPPVSAPAESQPDARDSWASAILDDFEVLSAWQVEASDGVRARIDSIAGVEGNALGLEFDFQGHGGHASARRALALDLPENFELSFDLRGNAPPNDLQLKLVDASGENVWWFRRADFEFSKDWRRVVVKKRQLEFAWGPTDNRELDRTASLELVVAAGRGGGKGSVAIDRLRLSALPVPPAVPPAPLATAFGSRSGHAAPLAVDGRRDTAWQSEPGPNPQRLELDLGYQREFGGLMLYWQSGGHATHYEVELSSDRKRWTMVRRVEGGDGGRDPLRLPESQARFVRLSFERGVADAYALADVEVQPLEFGASPNAFVSAVAQQSARGHYPRAYVGEQSYWTLLAVDGGADSGLISEDGAVEFESGGVSLEPFVVSRSGLRTWAEVQSAHALVDGYLPVPSVTWRDREWELEVRAFAVGAPDKPTPRARYELRNLTSAPLGLNLVLAIRPFQVNPPTQSLNHAGGVSPIHRLNWDGQRLSINGARFIAPEQTPDHVGLSSFDAGGFPEKSAPAGGRSPSTLADTTGLASAALVYEVTLPPRGSATRWLTSGPAAPALAELEREERRVRSAWREKLNRVELRVPEAGQELVNTLRTALAHVLMTREGPVLKPGPRSYARSWIRDGVMMSESLLRLGHAKVASEYLNWYAPYQYENGKVPCCVDDRGADPVPENDSAGQLIHLAAQLYRFTHDRAQLDRAWPHVAKAASYLERLRQSERGRSNTTLERRAYFGLMPPSISHEGYSDKPAYSYWDNFWALIGYQDAVFLAEVLEQGDAAARLRAQRDEFRRELYASLTASIEHHGIDYLPGAADRGDFDATSTTIALAPGRERTALPQDLLVATFERYFGEFRERKAGTRRWDIYTPYELRNVGVFVRLGWRDRAVDLVDFFLNDRRPRAWNQWAEVVGRKPRAPRFVGDMPHSWVASDFIRAALDCFAYVRADDAAMVLAAGLPAHWLAGEGVEVRNLRTPYGPLSYRLRIRDRLELDVRGAAPPGGFVLPWPLLGAGGVARVNGARVAWNRRELELSGPSRASVELHD